MRSHILGIICFLALMAACMPAKKSNKVNVLSGNPVTENINTVNKKPAAKTVVNTTEMRTMARPLDIDRKEFISYAKGFLGTPYLYASADPAKGFDCSGFLFHIFKHFNVKSPRSSYDYENIGIETAIEKAKPGDIILFTAENFEKIGHIGIITETAPVINFIHSSSSRSGGVIISPLAGYYKNHFVKIIRVLK